MRREKSTEVQGLSFETPNPGAPNQVTLKRDLSLTLITFYGLGNILGAGIYVLVGKVAGEAGYFTPLSFFIASIIAGISAFSYAEMSSRYPVSAGEAVYIYEGFGIKNLSVVVGILIALTGIVSSAAIAHGFAGYIKVFFEISPWLAITLMLLVLTALAIWGINQSVMVAASLTVIEIIGLLIIIFVGTENVPVLLSRVEQGAGDAGQGIFLSDFSLLGVMSGAFLAFYAYIGFEDMVKVAEEVKQPQKNMPRAILLCVVLSTLLYSIVALVAISVLPPAELSLSDAPLAVVYEEATGRAPVIISIIGIFAVINGCLVQIIMSSRILYGMSHKGWLPAPLGIVHPLTRTPINSTLLTSVAILLFALVLSMVSLAEMTSYLVLIVFALVNLSLVRIKRREPSPEGVSVYWDWLPKLGFLTTAAFVAIELLSNIL
jgi:amino acid transporter